MPDPRHCQHNARQWCVQSIQMTAPFALTLLVSSRRPAIPRHDVHPPPHRRRPPLASLRQKSASSVNTWSARSPVTPAFWYSPTRFSKKLVLPCMEISSIHSNGLADPYSFS